jgi:heptosyltransferase II
MKILVISLAGIGDTLFATPLIHELRENFPDAVIDAFVLWSGSKQVLEGNPYVNTVYQQSLISAPKMESLEFLHRLRRNEYDVSFNVHPQSKVQYRLVARFIGAHTRISHDYDHGGALNRFLMNRTLPQDYTRHCVENDLSLLGLIGVKPKLPRHGYELFLSDAEEQWAAEFVALRGLAGRRLVGLHVGSGGTKNLPLRRWPVEHYVDLIRRLNRERPEVSILLFGGPEEHEAHKTILRETNSPLVLEPDTRNIRQAAALLKRCKVFLSVDTALMHLAAVARVPKQIVIETPTFNKTVEPLGREFVLVPNAAVAGRNLDYYRYDGEGIKGSAEELRRCMESVGVQAVLVAVSAAIDHQNGLGTFQQATASHD